MFNFVLHSLPLSINRTYASGRSRFYKKRGANDAQYAMQREAWMKCRPQEPLAGDLSMVARFYWGDYRRRDIDNGLKMTLDALTGVCYVDDRQITRLEVVKGVDKANPRVEIEIIETGKLSPSRAPDKRTKHIRAIMQDIRAQS